MYLDRLKTSESTGAHNTERELTGPFLKTLTRDIFLKCVRVEMKRNLRAFEDEGRDVASSKVGELDSITGFVSAGDLTLEAEPPLLRQKVRLVLSVSLINILWISLMPMLERGPRSDVRNKQPEISIATVSSMTLERA
jgi:hypothetical protein